MTKKSVVWKICFQNMECYEYFNLKSAWVNWNWVGIMWGQIIVEKCEWKKICCSECILWKNVVSKILWFQKSHYTSKEGYHKPTNKVWYSEMGLLAGKLLNSDSERDDKVAEVETEFENFISIISFLDLKVQ